jgi:hypothetical protein
MSLGVEGFVGEEIIFNDLERKPGDGKLLLDEPNLDR